MKKIYFHLLFIVMLTCCTSLQVFSKESGWEQGVGYKYQKLVINELKRFQLSSGGDSIYTYHENGMMRTWDSKSGKLLDSINFSPLPNIFCFSKDGKTAIVSFGEPDSSKQRLQIYNIAQKKVHIEDSIDFLNIFPFASTLQECTNVKYYFHEWFNSYNPFNYIFDKNELYLKVRCQGSGRYYDPDFGACSMIDETGYLGIMEVTNKSFVKKKQIYNQNVIDYVQYNDSIYVFSTYNINVISPPSVFTPKKYKSSNKLIKCNVERETELTLLSYESYTGPYAEYGKIDLTCLKDTVLLRITSGHLYYYIDLNNPSGKKLVPFQIPLIASYGNNVTYGAKDVLIMNQDSNFYFCNIRNGNLIRTIGCPIDATSFILINNDKSILAYNIQGEMVLVNIEEANSMENDTYIFVQDKIVYPNPTSGIITLSSGNFLPQQLQIEISDISGKNIKTLYDKLYNQEELQFDISDMSNGTYIITARQNIGVQTFKVIKGE